MRRRLLIKAARTAVILLKVAVKIVKAAADETPNKIDDALADGVLSVLEMTEDILRDT